jgi:hypothetical protein
VVSTTLQVSALFANPWLEHIECHDLLAGVAGVLTQLKQYEAAAADAAELCGTSGHSSGTAFSRQVEELFLTWGAREMRRYAGSVLLVIGMFGVLSWQQQQQPH